MKLTTAWMLNNFVPAKKGMHELDIENRRAVFKDFFGEHRHLWPDMFFDATDMALYNDKVVFKVLFKSQDTLVFSASSRKGQPSPFMFAQVGVTLEQAAAWVAFGGTAKIVNFKQALIENNEAIKKVMSQQTRLKKRFDKVNKKLTKIYGTDDWEDRVDGICEARELVGYSILWDDLVALCEAHAKTC